MESVLVVAGALAIPLLTIYWLLVKPVRVAKKQAADKPHPRRSVWVIWIKLMLWRGPVFAICILPALAVISTPKEARCSKEYYFGCCSAISAFRTRIRMYQADHGCLPGRPADYAGDEWRSWDVVPKAGWNSDALDCATQILLSQDANEWLCTQIGAAGMWPTNRFVSGTVRTNASPVQRDLAIDQTYFDGVYSSNADYQYRVEYANEKTGAYMYCVAVAGGVTCKHHKKSHLKGTGYAVLEIYNPAWSNALMTATYGRYDTDDGFKLKEPLTIQAFNTADPGAYARANCIPIPTWSVVTGALTTAGGELDRALLRNQFGWSY